MGRTISPEELPVWVPGEVLCASDELGWKGVGQRTYRYQGLDVPIPPLDHFMIVRYSIGHTPMDRCFDEHWSRAHCGAGDVSLLTMSEPSHWHWTEQIDVSHVYLSNDLMSRVASDVMERSIAEVRLHDVLRAQDPILVAITDAITHEARHQGLGGALYAEALGMQLSVHLLRHYASIEFRSAGERHCLSSAQIRRVREYVDAHLHDALSIQALAEAVGLGAWTFARHFRAATGRAPHAFVIDQRVERARRLLISGDLAIKEIAGHCGFSDQAHMTRVVRARLGATPAQLRSSARRC